jgi:hypothetical protein
VQGTPSSAVLLFRHKGLSNSAQFDRCRFINSCGLAPSCSPVALSMNPGVNSSECMQLSHAAAALRSPLLVLAELVLLRIKDSAAVSISNLTLGFLLGIGNVSFTSCEIDDSVARPWLSATPGFTDVSATAMTVRNPHGCTTAGLVVPAKCEP